MEKFSALLAICAGNSPVTGEFPAQRPVTRSLDVSFDLRLKNSWVNNRKAGDLRRQRANYDVIVMIFVCRRNLAVVTPVKYECDTKDQTYTLAKAEHYQANE